MSHAPRVLRHVYRMPEPAGQWRAGPAQARLGYDHQADFCILTIWGCIGQARAEDVQLGNLKVGKN
jgi:hypothetical protein